MCEGTISKKKVPGPPLMEAVTFDLMQKLRKRSLTKFNAGCASTGFFKVKFNDAFHERGEKVAESSVCQTC